MAEYIPWNKPIIIEKSCPICGGDLEFRITGSIEHDDGLMHPNDFDVECRNENIEKGKIHNIQMPYVDWHPYIWPIEEELENKYYTD